MKEKKLVKPRSGLVAALDIGSSKIACFIARLDEMGRPHVVGVGHQPSRGIRAGAIVDMEAVRDAIVNAVHTAEHMADDTVRHVVVNLTCGRPRSETLGIEVSIAGHEVAGSDVRRVLDQGRQFDGLHDRELIHTIPVGFRIDGNRGIRDPRGMFGDRLGVEMHVVSADTGPVRTLATCIAGCHLDVDSFVVTPYAAGLACLVEDEINLGATVIDMGGGTTTIAVFDDGMVVHTETIGVGGNLVTTDIAHGLSTPLAQAERMKIKYGSAQNRPGDEDALIDVPQLGGIDSGAPNHMPKSLLTGIVRPRLEETFELVRGRLEASGFASSAGRRVILTGGASQLHGLRDLAGSILDRPVRIGRPHRVRGLAEAATGPAFSCCAGLLQFIAQQQQKDSTFEAFAAIGAVRRPEDRRGMFGRIGSWLQENF